MDRHARPRLQPRGAMLRGDDAVPRLDIRHHHTDADGETAAYPWFYPGDAGNHVRLHFPVGDRHPLCRLPEPQALFAERVQRHRYRRCGAAFSALLHRLHAHRGGQGRVRIHLLHTPVHRADHKDPEDAPHLQEVPPPPQRLRARARGAPGAALHAGRHPADLLLAGLPAGAPLQHRVPAEGNVLHHHHDDYCGVRRHLPDDQQRPHRGVPVHGGGGALHGHAHRHHRQRLHRDVEGPRPHPPHQANPREPFPVGLLGRGHPLALPGLRPGRGR
mmetsp:Transcript_115359/g.326875  ORF Transcript_115359/g.326875 Transcript_115359/m.326875 type:complete len:274 (+) Transcript_115359:536-1357(+)